MALFGFLGKEKSGNIAKDRLKFVLIHDRSMISPRVLDDMRDEIIAVISKYVDIDRDSLNIEVSQCENNERKTTLVANIPIKGSK
ncbi:cell division topological specificity factor MinE [Cetobacterium sp. SF1]|uniref:cell division topological specificity factor MinE n=1 Tax=unclassified Cetobacterium TaxID=2630983 RepID=UPI003CF9C5D7